MRVLLPPSETKRVGGSGALALAGLSRHAELGSSREAVMAALEALSQDPDRAAKSLGLGVKNRHELDHNLVLRSSGVLPAIDRYTGVLFDAIEVEGLTADERGWLDRHVSVQSALFGLIDACDLIPAYRLSAGTSLPALGAGLKKFWRAAHAGACGFGDDIVLDLRSQSYADLAPIPGAIQLHVATLASDGSTRALNHFNKAAKGDLVRRLAVSDARVSSVAELLGWAESAGLELRRDDADEARLTLLTEIGAPATSAAR